MAEKTNPDETSSYSLPQIYVWVKGLEGKANNLLREVDVLKNDLIKKQSALKEEIKTMGEELLESRHAQQQMQQKMDIIIKELRNTAGKEEIQSLQKYVDLWNPLNFITKRDLERSVESKLKESLVMYQEKTHEKHK